MAVCVIGGEGVAALYCTTSMTAFGPVFASRYEAEDFLEWITPRHGDPRDIREPELLRLHQEWARLREMETA